MNSLCEELKSNFRRIMNYYYIRIQIWYLRQTRVAWKDFKLIPFGEYYFFQKHSAMNLSFHFAIMIFFLRHGCELVQKLWLEMYHFWWKWKEMRQGMGQTLKALLCRRRLLCIVGSSGPDVALNERCYNLSRHSCHWKNFLTSNEPKMLWQDKYISSSITSTQFYS